ncbi:flavin-containing monooxygenase [Roseofilum casamattae]|uniref:NAD(P)/FAD-dependent oxidoreductase n=1 Tax=Roseofilum casamattae BLCC-M143 TaxID=3022442 RepID=A0ABT7BVE7_9CYAN|nr:NAD(P)/FAD-dependent oxidoreductase [Roseofilum casamattae]MDJ1182479.1 NAD(P)/FAD-dependent oxidoreductase [Roseofilum casamattae BLCC-M143]
MTNGTVNQSKSPLEILIIGAGFAGLGMGITLKKAGITSFKIYEKANNLGGTWHHNTYPGCGCDVPSFLYSYSFAPKSDWTRDYPKQKEILTYLEDCAEEYEITRHIHLNTEISEAVFNEKETIWNVSTSSGEQLQANIVISACGQLNNPKIANIKGRETFQGTQFHSARWNHNYDFNGKTVGVIGTGASAVQFLPVIAQQVKKLIVFHRSANWVIPKSDRQLTEFDHWLFRTFPFLMTLYRWSVYLYFESLLVTINLQKDGIAGKIAAIWLNNYRESRVKDERLKEVLRPKEPVLCKRFLLSSNYYETLQLPNVEVIDQPIDKITENAIATTDGKEHEIDALIWATGFQSTKFLSSLKIVGPHQKSLHETWENGPQAYKGIVVPDFPNFFMLYGPNTNLGSNSIVFMLECQANYIRSCIEMMQEQGITNLKVKPETNTEFNEKLQESAEKTVWMNNCSSWYKNEDGKLTNNWPYSSVRYWFATRKADRNDFICS